MKSSKLEKKRLRNYLLTGKFFVFRLTHNSGAIFEWSIRTPQNINHYFNTGHRIQAFTDQVSNIMRYYFETLQKHTL